MIDQDKWIGAQSVMKSLISISNGTIDEDKFEKAFKSIMRIMEDYATIPEGEEWMNTGVLLGSLYWNAVDKAKEHFLTQWGIQKKDKDGKWYVFCQHKNMTKFVNEMKIREENFEDMVKSKETK